MLIRKEEARLFLLGEEEGKTLPPASLLCSALESRRKAHPSFFLALLCPCLHECESAAGDWKGKRREKGLAVIFFRKKLEKSFVSAGKRSVVKDDERDHHLPAHHRHRLHRPHHHLGRRGRFGSGQEAGVKKIAQVDKTKYRLNS